MIDLELYYDRQLVNLISIVLESIGIDRKVIKLIMKVIPAMTHCIWMGYRISINAYRSKSERTARTGQGNIISREEYKAKFCFIFKVVKNTNNGAIIISPIIQNKI